MLHTLKTSVSHLLIVTFCPILLQEYEGPLLPSLLYLLHSISSTSMAKFVDWSGKSLTEDVTLSKMTISFIFCSVFLGAGVTSVAHSTHFCMMAMTYSF